MTAEAFTSKAIIIAKLTNYCSSCYTQSMFAKIYQHFKTFKPISKLTAYVVNYRKYLQIGRAHV
jgi:hypothetical protein